MHDVRSNNNGSCTMTKSKSQNGSHTALMLDTVYQGDCVSIMETLPEKSVDVIFADPPYNLQLQQSLLRPNQTVVDAVDDEWDQFDSLQAYDAFTRAWLMTARRILKDDGTLWVIGSYHNIYRVGSILMDLGYWIINDVVWYKTNPMPNFRGTRFTNATETLLWVQKSQQQKRYTFNYQSMKHVNDDKQMPNVWHLPICSGPERIRINGVKAHATQKPEALLYRVLLASTNPGDVVLDPFFGSGTTGVVAKKLFRHYIGIEREADYIEIAQQRLAAVQPTLLGEEILVTPTKRHQPRVSPGMLIEQGYLNVGQTLYGPKCQHSARLRADGTLVNKAQGINGSIHQAAAALLKKSAHNGWDFWYVENSDGELVSIDTLRENYRAFMKANSNEAD